MEIHPMPSKIKFPGARKGRVLTNCTLVILSAFLMLADVQPANAGKLRNNGTVVVLHGATNTYQTVSNGRGATGGFIWNGGTITLNQQANFYNYDSVGNTAPGTVHNTYGNSYGIINTRNFNNGSAAYVGTFLNDSSTVGGGTLNIAGAFTNGTPSKFTTLKGTVNYNGGIAQQISDSVNSNTYGTLQTATGGTKTMINPITVATALSIGAGSTLNENGKTLTINGTSSNAGTFTANGAGSTTIYNGSGAQTVLAATYYNLTVQSTGQKSAAGAVTVSNLLSVATANDSLDFAANTFTLSPGASVTSSGKLKSSGTVTVPSLNPTIGGTFVYYGGAQTVAGANYTNLVLRNAGVKTLPGTDTVAVSGTYTMEASPTRTYAAGNTFIYNGTGAQSIVGGAGDSYQRLILSSATDTSSANYKTIAGGNVTITNNASAGFIVLGTTAVDMGANSITFGASHSDSIQGNSKVKWSGNNVYLPGTGVTEFYGSGAGSVVAGAAYGNMLFTGSGVKSIGAGVTVTATGGASSTTGVYVYNNLTVAATGVLNVTHMDLNNDGVLTNNGSITVN